MSDDYETARVTITRVLTADGEDLHYVEATPGMGLVEALGLMRLAEDTLIKFPPADEPEEAADAELADLTKAVERGLDLADVWATTEPETTMTRAWAAQVLREVLT